MFELLAIAGLDKIPRRIHRAKWGLDASVLKVELSESSTKQESQMTWIYFYWMTKCLVTFSPILCECRFNRICAVTFAESHRIRRYTPMRVNGGLAPTILISRT